MTLRDDSEAIKRKARELGISVTLREPTPEEEASTWLFMRGKAKSFDASGFHIPGDEPVDFHLPGLHDQRTHGRRRVHSVDEALERLAAGKQVILDQPSQVSTLLDKLAVRVKEAERKGEKAPNINLCDVSVPGTNIFCAGNKGIARANMPQLKGKVRPGSKGERIANEKGKVDLGEAFAEHLRQSGVGVKHEEINASHLRATQDELVGSKVAGMAAFLRDGGHMAGSIFVSKDDYVVDGHHRWAAQVGVEYGGDDFKLPIERVDMPILDVLAEASKFADEWGIAQKTFNASAFSPLHPLDLRFNPDEPRDEHGRWTHLGGVASGLKDLMGDGGRVLSPSELNAVHDRLGKLDPGAQKTDPLRESRGAGLAYGDGYLDVLARERGFDAPPRRVSPEELDAIDGAAMYRGVSKDKYAKEFHSGEYHAGRGIYGNGYYFAQSYKRGPRPPNLPRHYKWVSQDESAWREAYRFGQGNITRAKLSPDAKGGDYQELYDATIAWRKSNGESGGVNPADLGRVALMSGYDYFKTEDNYIVLLNRGAAITDGENHIGRYE